MHYGKGLVIMDQPLAIGTQAPDFTLKSGDGEAITLSSLRGQKTVLNFYPADWSPGCTNQMDAYARDYNQFADQGARVFGISVDSVWSHKAWKDSRGLKIELLADFNPKGEVGKQYGVFNEERGTHRRVTFVIDEQGVIRDVQEAKAGEFPTADAVCEVLQKIG
jgi:peroxiredoxin